MSLLLVFSALATLILAAPTQEMSLLSRDDAAGANPRGISYNDAKLAALFHVAGSKMVSEHFLHGRFSLIQAFRTGEKFN